MRWKKNGMKRVTVVKNGIRFHLHRRRWSSNGPSSDAIKTLCQCDFNIGMVRCCTALCVVMSFLCELHNIIALHFVRFCSFTLFLSLSRACSFCLISYCCVYSSCIEYKCSMNAKCSSVCFLHFLGFSIKAEPFSVCHSLLAFFIFANVSSDNKFIGNSSLLFCYSTFSNVCNPSMDNKLN